MMGQQSLRPRAAQDGQGLVEQLGAGAPFDPERLLLVWVCNSEPEGRQQATVGQPIECRQLLGQHDGVATG